MLTHRVLFILSVAKYLFFNAIMRFFTFVQNDKFAYGINWGRNCYINSLKY